MCIVLGKRCDGLCGTKEKYYISKTQISQNCNQQSDDQSRKKCNRSHLFGKLPLSGADGTCNVIAASHTDHEGQGLYDRHGRKYDADGTRSTGTKLTYKKGISHIINRCDQHADNGWHSQLWNDPVDWCICHLIILIVNSCCIRHRCTPHFS